MPKKKAAEPATEEAQSEPKPWEFRFKWDGKTYAIEIEELTFGERADLEQYMGGAWPLVLASAWAASAKVLIYLAYIAVRRTNPDVELDDFRELTDDDILVAGEEDGGEERPPSTGGEAETSGASSSSSGSGSSRRTSKGGPRAS